MSDRLALAHAIEEAGIPREKAEGMAAAIVRLVEGGGATKADLLAQGAELKTEVAAFRGDLKADIAAGRTDITELGTASRAELQAQGTDLKADISAVRTELRNLKTQLAGETGRVANRNFGWLLGIMLCGFIVVLGAIAHGFHWL
jgi:hypothetical protein